MCNPLRISHNMTASSSLNIYFVYQFGQNTAGTMMSSVKNEEFVIVAKATSYWSLLTYSDHSVMEWTANKFRSTIRTGQTTWPV